MTTTLKILMLIAAIIAAVTAALMMHGCAHVISVGKACKPTPADVDAALIDLQTDGWKAALEQLALAKGVCIAKAAVQEVIDALTPKTGQAALEAPGVTPTNAELVERGKEFLNSH